KSDRRTVAVARDAEIYELLVGEIGAGQDARHAAVHGVEAVRVAEKVVRRLRGAADAGKLGDAIRLDVEFVAGLNQRGTDRIVAAAGAQGRNRAFIIAMGEAELVRHKARVMQLRF